MSVVHEKHTWKSYDVTCEKLLEVEKVKLKKNFTIFEQNYFLFKFMKFTKVSSLGFDLWTQIHQVSLIFNFFNFSRRKKVFYPL